jgi:L-ascorbate peroxidase
MKWHKEIRFHCETTCINTRVRTTFTPSITRGEPASQPADKTGAKSQMAQYLSQLTVPPPKSQPMASLSGGAATTTRLLPSASRVRLSICSAPSSLSLASSSSYSPSSLKCLRFPPLSPLIFKDQVSFPLPLYI